MGTKRKETDKLHLDDLLELHTKELLSLAKPVRHEQKMEQVNRC